MPRGANPGERERSSGRCAMHAVCRKRQGLPWAPDNQPKGIVSHSNHLVSVQVRKGPFEPDDLGLAFGAGSYPKLVKQVTAEDTTLRRKALQHGKWPTFKLGALTTAPMMC